MEIKLNLHNNQIGVLGISLTIPFGGIKKGSSQLVGEYSVLMKLYSQIIRLCQILKF